MVTHIVFFNIDPSLNKQTVYADLKAQLEGLPAEIDSLVSLEFGLDFNGSDAAYDCALYTTFANKAGLDAYQHHPAHLRVKEYLGRVTTARAVVDYELPASTF